MLSLTPHLRPAMAGAALLLLGGLVQAQTVAIDFQAAGTAPAGGTLSNGVTWNVNLGGGWVANAAGGYYRYRPSTDGVQTFTFSSPVDLEFGVTDLQNANEGVTLPAGTSCIVPATATGITWNPATFTLQNGPTRNANGSNHVFACTLSSVSTLTLDGNGMNPGVRRGLNYLRVTPTATTMTAAYSNVPGSLATGATATGVTLTCTNTGPNTATNASCVPTATGGGTISNLSCTPASPAATLASGSAIVCTFDVAATAAAGGDVVLEGTTAANNAPAVTPVTANIPVTAVPAAAMTPSFGALPANLTAGQTVTGLTLTCTNSGPAAAANASCVPTATAGGTVSNVVCTPAAPVASLASGSAIACTFDLAVTAAAGGNVVLEGTTAANNAPAVAPATASIPVATAAAANVQAVPTLHFWGLLLMSALLGLGGAIGKRRRG